MDTPTTGQDTRVPQCTNNCNSSSNSKGAEPARSDCNPCTEENDSFTAVPNLSTPQKTKAKAGVIDVDGLEDSGTDNDTKPTGVVCGAKTNTRRTIDFYAIDSDSSACSIGLGAPTTHTLHAYEGTFSEAEVEFSANNTITEGVCGLDESLDVDVLDGIGTDAQTHTSLEQDHSTTGTEDPPTGCERDSLGHRIADGVFKRTRASTSGKHAEDILDRQLSGLWVKAPLSEFRRVARSAVSAGLSAQSASVIGTSADDPYELVLTRHAPQSTDGLSLHDASLVNRGADNLGGPTITEHGSQSTDGTPLPRSEGFKKPETVQRITQRRKLDTTKRYCKVQTCPYWVYTEGSGGQMKLHLRAKHKLSDADITRLLEDTTLATDEGDRPYATLGTSTPLPIVGHTRLSLSEGEVELTATSECGIAGPEPEVCTRAQALAVTGADETGAAESTTAHHSTMDTNVVDNHADGVDQGVCVQSTDRSGRSSGVPSTGRISQSTCVQGTNLIRHQRLKTKTLPDMPSMCPGAEVSAETSSTNTDHTYTQPNRGHKGLQGQLSPKVIPVVTLKKKAPQGTVSITQPRTSTHHFRKRKRKPLPEIRESEREVIPVVTMRESIEVPRKGGIKKVHTCEWSNCRRFFITRQEMESHVDFVHLKRTVTLARKRDMTTPIQKATQPASEQATATRAEVSSSIYKQAHTDRSPKAIAKRSDAAKVQQGQTQYTHTPTQTHPHARTRSQVQIHTHTHNKIRANRDPTWEPPSPSPTSAYHKRTNKLTRQKTVQNHSNYFMKATPGEQVTRRPRVPCDSCNQTFSTPKSLQIHTRCVHLPNLN